MLVSRRSVTAYRFGPFRLSVRDRIVERNGERIQLTPKVIDTLFVLVENAKQVVTKEALMKAVWPDVTVVESGLTRNISSLRKALEEGGQEGSYLETVPKRGYRFVAEVIEEVAADIPEAAAVAPALPPVHPEPRRPRWLIAAACAAAITLIGALWLLPRQQRGRSLAAAEPSVRIGEHLLYKLAPEEALRASEHFERAIAENPASAGAHGGLAVSLTALSLFGVHPLSEVMPRAEKSAIRAVQLDEKSSTAHVAMGMVQMIWKWDFGRSEAEFRRALELDPESVQARLGYARLKLITGDPRDALRRVEESLQFDPASPPLGTEYCRVFYFLRDFRRAEAECRKVLDRERGYALAHYYLALSLGSLGRIEEANQSLDRSGLMPGVVAADRAWLSARAGDRRPAFAALEERRELVRRGKIDPTAKLLLAVVLNRMDEAYEALEAGLRTRAPEMLTLHIEPRLDPVRSDPRYASVLARIGINIPGQP